MRFRLASLLALFLLGVLAACQASPPATQQPAALHVATATPTAVSAPPHVLRVWLPATLDPKGMPHAYEMLADRIQAFAAAHNVTVEIRIKSLNGPAGILTTLNAARLVAPSAVPDVVLMPHTLLEAAAVKGLARPLPAEAFTAPLSAPDWFPYARQLATFQGLPYGVPFGGDALGLLYHPGVVPQPPTTWHAWLQIAQPWLFPLGDPRALALLALYRAAGGAWQDKAGRPTLDEEALQRMLTLLQQARQNNRLSPTLLTLTDDHMLWARDQGEAQALMITYLSHLLPGPDPRRLAPIPAAEGNKPLALADGLLWALTTSDTARQPLAVALLADLGAPDFVAQWTEAAGYLPPRQSILDGWGDAAHRTLVEAVVSSLQPMPPQQVITVLGPVLQKAAAQVVSGAQTPASAAHWAIGTLAEGGG